MRLNILFTNVSVANILTPSIGQAAHGL